MKLAKHFVRLGSASIPGKRATCNGKAKKAERPAKLQKDCYSTDPFVCCLVEALFPTFRLSSLQEGLQRGFTIGPDRSSQRIITISCSKSDINSLLDQSIENYPYITVTLESRCVYSWLQREHRVQSAAIPLFIDVRRRMRLGSLAKCIAIMFPFAEV